LRILKGNIFNALRKNRFFAAWHFFKSIFVDELMRDLRSGDPKR